MWVGGVFMLRRVYLHVGKGTRVVAVKCKLLRKASCCFLHARCIPVSIHAQVPSTHCRQARIQDHRSCVKSSVQNRTKVVAWPHRARRVNRQFKHQTLTQTQTLITGEFSLPNVWKADLRRTQNIRKGSLALQCYVGVNVLVLKLSNVSEIRCHLFWEMQKRNANVNLDFALFVWHLFWVRTAIGFCH